MLELLDLANKNASDITAIGLHGQTVFHHPKLPYNFTMQLGDPNTIIEKLKYQLLLISGREIWSMVVKVPP